MLFLVRRPGVLRIIDAVEKSATTENGKIIQIYREAFVFGLCQRRFKGVPNKNIRSLLGKPLLLHSLDQARQSGLFDCIVVSSDSPKILQMAKEWGVDHAIERPEELATDSLQNYL